MNRNFVFFVVFILLKTVQSEEFFTRTDNRLQCSINRPSLGQLERVQITSYSINIVFKNIFQTMKCSSIRFDLSIKNTRTELPERTIENIQRTNFYIDHLLPNQNYSLTVKISDGKSMRILPTYMFQTLPSFDFNTLTLFDQDLLAIEQIESVVFPHTHLYIVTLPQNARRSNIMGNITLSFMNNGKQYEYSNVVKPADNNIISAIGRITTKTIAFLIELPHENNTSSIEYKSVIQLFFSNDHRQAIIDHPVIVKYPSPITVEFFPVSARSMRVVIRHLCLSYMEVKGVVYNDSKVVSRGQCDITKKGISQADITNGLCSILFDKLQPEEHYTLSIRATCPITTSSTSSFVFYDRNRVFSFETPSGLPDDSPIVLSFHNKNQTLSWRSTLADAFYLGPRHYYELFTKSNDNWTLVYQGNQTEYRLTPSLMKKANLTFRLYVGNQYGRHENNYSQIDVHIDPVNYFNTYNQILILSILISFLLIAFAFLIFACYARNKKLYGKLQTNYSQNGDVSDKELDHLRALTYCSNLKDNILYTWNHTPTSVDIKKLPKIERVMIKLDRLIGKGAFGEVYAGTLSGDQSVAIKTLPSSASQLQREDFLKEAIIMNQFSHKHIIHLLGVCFHTDFQPQFLIIELMEQGDLQNYIRRARPTKDNDLCRLSYDDCLDIARQIADGACYLEQHSYVHRDLAARNCLVTTSGTVNGKIMVKIGDFGLARMLSQQDYYRKTGEALLPVRWMAPESLLDAVFTSDSDIWSYGIVLWEIITLGQVPYSTLNNQQVVSLITIARGTLEKPIHCTQSLYELMLSCWQYAPENRINFFDIHTRLNELLNDAGRETPVVWFSNETSSQGARTILDSVLSHIEPPTSTSFECSDAGECRSSTSGCFSSMTESNSQLHQHTHHPSKTNPPYQFRLIDDTTSNELAYEDDHSDIIVRSV